MDRWEKAIGGPEFLLWVVRMECMFRLILAGDLKSVYGAVKGRT